MGERFDLLLKGGTLADCRDDECADFAIRGGVIAARGQIAREDAAHVLDVKGLHILPGVIDTQVHFREPGDATAETLASGSRAALLGGVSGVFEMPNTRPPTIDHAALADKHRRAADQMFCDYAFYAGGIGDNVDLLPELERAEGCCGIKVFMGSSTGTLLASDDETLARILAQLSYVAAFHAEDEARLVARKGKAERGRPFTHPVWRDEESALLATQRLIRLARAAGRQVHVLHITTAEEMAFLARHKDIASSEVTPQHLTLLAPECYERLGTYAQMNPPIRGARHHAALWRGIADGTVNMIGSDHAPHSRAAKEKPYPESPSGMPGVQTLLPIMLDHVNAGRLSLARLIHLTSVNPVKRFGIRERNGLEIGAAGTLTIVDLKARRRISDDWIASPCGWTPFDGREVIGWPQGVILKGRLAMWQDELMGKPCGQPFRFDRMAKR